MMTFPMQTKYDGMMGMMTKTQRIVNELEKKGNGLTDDEDLIEEDDLVCYGISLEMLDEELVCLSLAAEQEQENLRRQQTTEYRECNGNSEYSATEKTEQAENK